jgi:hypothetical protein
MTDSLQLDTGLRRIAVNGDPNRVISFNPKDVVFAEKFYSLVDELRAKEKELIRRADELDAESEEDEYGMPINAKDRLALIHEVCDWAYAKIDHLFGEGTSDKVFQGVKSLEVCGEFFNGIVPFIEEARSEKIGKYAKLVAERKEIENKKAVMD